MLQRVESKSIAPSIVATDRTGSDFAISCQRILDEALLYWPKDWAKTLARITKRSTRTCYRWRAKDPGKRTEPEASDIIAIVAAMRAEYEARGKIFEQLSLDLA